MRRFLWIPFVLSAAFFVSANEPSKTVSEADDRWIYEVEVGDGVRYYRLSLMENQSVAFTQWSEDEPTVEERYYLVQDEYATVRKRFEAFFSAIGELPIREMNQQPQFIFKEVTPELVVTHEFAGSQPKAWEFLDEVAGQLAINLPFGPLDEPAEAK